MKYYKSEELVELFEELDVNLRATWEDVTSIICDFSDLLIKRTRTIKEIEGLVYLLTARYYYTEARRVKRFGLNKLK